MKVILIVFILLVNTIFASETIFNSGEKKVSIIELYTSQGCSSCPIADEWISELKTHHKLFKDFIPLSFHVTYWDYIGWQDIFANKLNDNRQRNYANKVWKKNSVYTPQFVIDTKEYRQWFFNKNFPELEKKYAGNLNISFDKNKLLEVKYNNKKIKNKQVLINIVLLGFDYKINIKSGENKAKTLKHDFVVLEHIQKNSKIINNSLNFKDKIYKFNKKKNRKYALAVWISDNKYNQLQAVGGYL